MYWHMFNKSGDNSEVMWKIYEQIHLWFLVVLVFNHEDDVFWFFRRWMALLGDDPQYGPIEPLAGVVRVPPPVKDTAASVCGFRVNVDR